MLRVHVEPEKTECGPFSPKKRRFLLDLIHQAFCWHFAASIGSVHLLIFVREGCPPEHGQATRNRVAVGPAPPSFDGQAAPFTDRGKRWRIPKLSRSAPFDTIILARLVWRWKHAKDKRSGCAPAQGTPWGQCGTPECTRHWRSWSRSREPDRTSSSARW